MRHNKCFTVQTVLLYALIKVLLQSFTNTDITLHKYYSMFVRVMSEFDGMFMSLIVCIYEFDNIYA